MKARLALALSKLMAAAAKAPEPALPEMRYGFDTRVIAAWKSQRSNPGWNFSLLKTAFVSATVLVALSFVANQRLSLVESQNELTIADSVIRLSMNP